MSITENAYHALTDIFAEHANLQSKLDLAQQAIEAQRKDAEAYRRFYKILPASIIFTSMFNGIDYTSLLIMPASFIMCWWAKFQDRNAQDQINKAEEMRHKDAGKLEEFRGDIQKKLEKLSPELAKISIPENLNWSAFLRFAFNQGVETLGGQSERDSSIKISKEVLDKIVLLEEATASYQDNIKRQRSFADSVRVGFRSVPLAYIRYVNYRVDKYYQKHVYPHVQAYTRLMQSMTEKEDLNYEYVPPLSDTLEYCINKQKNLCL